MSSGSMRATDQRSSLGLETSTQNCSKHDREAWSRHGLGAAAVMAVSRFREPSSSDIRREITARLGPHWLRLEPSSDPHYVRRNPDFVRWSGASTRAPESGLTSTAGECV